MRGKNWVKVKKVRYNDERITQKYMYRLTSDIYAR